MKHFNIEASIHVQFIEDVQARFGRCCQMRNNNRANGLVKREALDRQLSPDRRVRAMKQSFFLLTEQRVYKTVKRRLRG